MYPVSTLIVESKHLSFLSVSARAHYRTSLACHMLTTFFFCLSRRCKAEVQAAWRTKRARDIRIRAWRRKISARWCEGRFHLLLMIKIYFFHFMHPDRFAYVTWTGASYIIRKKKRKNEPYIVDYFDILRNKGVVEIIITVCKLSYYYVRSSTRRICSSLEKQAFVNA